MAAVIVSSKVAKEIRKSGIPKEDWDHLRRRLERIAGEPHAIHPDVKRFENGYRVRHGRWRVIYIVTAKGDIEVIRAAHRREVYRDER
jgi:mRNA-degrading endonuclease RelE of RelBE toxin-antitoxin system